MIRHWPGREIRHRHLVAVIGERSSNVDSFAARLRLHALDAIDGASGRNSKL